MADPLTPRAAIAAMAPYSPPSAGRAGKLRLDFNENTVGCSPKVIECVQKYLTADHLTIYPEYQDARRDLGAFFGVSPEEFTITNGTDEAIQLMINTFIDDGDDVLLLKPSYAMYRFYAEVAGASVREVEYAADLSFPLADFLDELRPETRAILIANPNNPTGSAIGLEQIELILETAPEAAVLIDEAYFEFYGVTALRWINEYKNLFVSRTFSKAYGMAAMRCGCLFTCAENAAWIRKAQSPYSVNLLAVIAARAAVLDREYIAKYVGEALAARETAYVGFERLGIQYFPSQANFVLFQAGDRAIPIRDALRERGVLVRDRSYEIPGCVRVTIGTRAQVERFLTELETFMEELIVFDMDGVLAEVTESYREAIVQTVEHFTGMRIERDLIQDYKNQGGWNNDWALSQKIAADLGVEVPYDTVVNYFNEIFIGKNGDGLIQREQWFPKPGLIERLRERFDLAIFTGRLQYEAEITLKRFAPDCSFDPLLCAEHVANSKPAPDGLLDIQRRKPGRKLWYVGDTVDDARSARAAGVPFIGIAARNHSRRDEILRLFQEEQAVAVLENVNEIEPIVIKDAL